MARRSTVFELVINDCADLFHAERAAQSAFATRASVFAAAAFQRAHRERLERRDAGDRDGVEYWDAEIRDMESALLRIAGASDVADRAAMWETELPLFGGSGSVRERVVH